MLNSFGASIGVFMMGTDLIGEIGLAPGMGGGVAGLETRGGGDAAGAGLLILNPPMAAGGWAIMPAVAGTAGAEANCWAKS